MSLTQDQRRWLGTAIAMAKADGVLKLDEKKLIDEVSDQLGLTTEGRVEVEKMLQNPPSPVELATWAMGAKDRLGLYRMARRMAEADGETEEHEAALLRCLASVLKLSPRELEQAGEG
jgi:tellurite resistance protein